MNTELVDHITYTYLMKKTCFIEYKIRFNAIYDKRDLNFPIVNFLFMDSNIPAAPAYKVYISQLIRHFRVCGSYQDFLDRVLLLTSKLLFKGFLVIKLQLWICSVCCHHNAVLSSFMAYFRDCSKSSTTHNTHWAETAYPSGTPEFTPVVSGVRVVHVI